MLFNSNIFLFLFVPIFFVIYFLLPSKLKNYFILIASCIFYSWGEPSFIFVVIASAFFDWALSFLIYKNIKTNYGKIYLCLGVFLNLALLFYFKYFNFFIDNINEFLSLIHMQPLGAIKVILPLAVSFIVFEKITYLVDVYREKGKPSSSFFNYLTYVLLFPKLIAGPIIKYHDIEGQIKERKIKQSDVYEGFFRFSKGLFKKVVIADTLAKVVDAIFSLSPYSLGFYDAWLGAVCFSIQIYFDFSGYSDMAIGLMRAMGFKIGENFNLPYVARNFTDFWRRWHISLSSFIKEYLYIPLGGNRVSKIRQYFNLFLCFLISGLWHGANWTFVLWGAYHGFFITMDKVLNLKVERNLFKITQILITLFLLIIGWAAFRSQNIYQFVSFLKSMFMFNSFDFNSSAEFTKDVIFWLIFGIFASFIPIFMFYKKMVKEIDERFYFKFLLFALLMFFVIGKISVGSNVTFIYFRF